ncbi:hypothetical protein [Nocardioides sp. SYSU DS0663]|uniref:hypothetical protein n=1 Tax=Nocardioides sp. SYSU DS0663 TaxID=3416445 RepID=UPI003F4C2ABC
MNPMPASEVRRRGDRMRRRNTALATVGGAVAALAVVAVPLAVVNGDEPDREIQPAPSVEWRQEVPEGFPLGAGLGGQAIDEPALDAATPCGTPFWTDTGTVDVARESRGDGVESRSGRTLALYPDADAAAQAVDDIRGAVADCPEQPVTDDTTRVTEVLDRDLATEESFVVVDRVRFDDGSWADLTTTQVARTGNAVLLDQGFGSAAEDQAVEFNLANQLERAAEPLAELCIFAADPCDVDDAPGEDTGGDDTGGEEAPAAATLPDDFPLAAGYPTSDEGEGFGLEGPSRALEPLVPQACGATAPVPPHVDLLRASWTAPEDYRQRQLVAFADEEAAEAYRRSVLAVFEGCIGGVTTGPDRRLTQVITDVSDLGDAAGGAVTRYESGGSPIPGMSTVLVVRVGRTVLLATADDEGGAGPNVGGQVQDAFNRIVEESTVVLEAMAGL